MLRILIAALIFIIFSAQSPLPEKEISRYQKEIEKLLQSQDKGLKERMKQKALETYKMHKQVEKEQKARETAHKILPSCLSKHKRSSYPSSARLYVFISSSIPMQILKNYRDDLMRLKGRGVMVLRGIIGDGRKIKPTLDFLWALFDSSEQKTVPVEINPVLFRKLKIKRAPAIALVIKDDYLNLNEDDFCIIEGDVSIEYALKKFMECQEVAWIARSLYRYFEEDWFEKR